MIQSVPLPEQAFLQRYVESGDYTDCFLTSIDTDVSLPSYIEAFYTTAIFKAERCILKWLVSRPSSDDEAHELAEGRRESFAAWSVQNRADEQIILIDMHGRTCSWLMVAPADGATQLYFGSAVIKTEPTPTGRKMAWTYRALLGFHRLYSRILLSAARRRLRRSS